MSKSFLIDTTLCTACRACQVACKQWHGLPAEATTNRGTFENPPDLSFDTYKVVRMREEVINGKLDWLFFPEQCRHCVEAPCLETAKVPQAIYKDEATNAILFTAETKSLTADEIISSCPYNIPRKRDDGTLAKCDMCNDRVHNGLLPACVQTCPTGAMLFGERKEILEAAQKRLEKVKQKHPTAVLIDPDTVNVVYLVAYPPEKYHKNAMAKYDTSGITRYAAIRKMFKPVSQVAAHFLS